MEHQQVAQKNNQSSNVAFVLGNGKSRLNLNLTNLKTHGIIYGCNALYREFDPDYLISVDVKMINEIIAAGYHRDHQVWTNPNKGVTTKVGINFFSPHKGWSSGPTALHFAGTHGYKEVYIFGFDYQGIEGKVNNVYADTFNYKKSNDAATYFGNWLSQTEKTVKDFKQIQFFRVIESGSFVPEKLIGVPNLHHITFENFAQKFPETVRTIENHQKSVI